MRFLSRLEFFSGVRCDFRESIYSLAKTRPSLPPFLPIGSFSFSFSFFPPVFRAVRSEKDPKTTTPLSMGTGPRGATRRCSKRTTPLPPVGSFF
ncbi:MAG: hypothetical protein BJ554DRAFT_1062 [Olpidium bornovanus]|uniref:Uncharacterized protein n=1 Tax=Olpidium bornovanus TaxID=278681 RepID=A0A8H8A1K9_9FUNG|nr:MAG: hypothetical protein BJ554DRAFT_1062 [Olpidium bornovanus]